MTALDQLGWTADKNRVRNREAGVCPVCGQPYDVTRTDPLEGRGEGAFYAHDSGGELVDLCVEWADGTVTRDATGLREGFMERA